MKILYGTTNPGKLAAMQKSVEGLSIEIIGLRDMEGELPRINENGKTPLENAEIKARAYYEAFHIPVFSCDSGLYFDELADEEQPGFPLDCLSIDIATGKYYYDLETKDVSTSVDDGVRAFFREIFCKGE